MKYAWLDLSPLSLVSWTQLIFFFFFDQGEKSGEGSVGDWRLYTEATLRTMQAKNRIKPSRQRGGSKLKQHREEWRPSTGGWTLGDTGHWTLKQHWGYQRLKTETTLGILEAQHWNNIGDTGDSTLKQCWGNWRFNTETTLGIPEAQHWNNTGDTRSWTLKHHRRYWRLNT